MSFSSPLVHTHFSVVGLTSFKQDIFWCFCFSSEHTASVFSPVGADAPLCSISFIHYKGNNPQCLGSPHPATPRLNQAGPSGLRRRLFSPVYLLVSKVPTRSW